jgi:hypothetical protein
MGSLVDDDEHRMKGKRKRWIDIEQRRRRRIDKWGRARRKFGSSGKRSSTNNGRRDRLRKMENGQKRICAR